MLRIKRTMNGYVKNACWKPGSTIPEYLPPHFFRTPLLEGTINETVEEPDEDRLLKNFDTLSLTETSNELDTVKRRVMAIESYLTRKSKPSVKVNKGIEI